MKCNDCSKCIVDPDTGSPVCTWKGAFVYGNMCETCDQKCTGRSESKNDD